MKLILAARRAHDEATLTRRLRGCVNLLTAANAEFAIEAVTANVMKGAPAARGKTSECCANSALSRWISCKLAFAGGRKGGKPPKVPRAAKNVPKSEAQLRELKALARSTGSDAHDSSDDTEVSAGVLTLSAVAVAVSRRVVVVACHCVWMRVRVRILV
jgi:hypothetical protein